MGIVEQVMDIPAEHEKNLFGQLDAYMKLIERNLNVTLVLRENGLKIIGEPERVEETKAVIKELLDLSVRGNVITEQNVNYALAIVTENRKHPEQEVHMKQFDQQILILNLKKLKIV